MFKVATIEFEICSSGKNSMNWHPVIFLNLVERVRTIHFCNDLSDHIRMGSGSCRESMFKLNETENESPVKRHGKLAASGISNLALEQLLWEIGHSTIKQAQKRIGDWMKIELDCGFI